MKRCSINSPASLQLDWLVFIWMLFIDELVKLQFQFVKIG
jgi:hypothetical protein